MIVPPVQPPCAAARCGVPAIEDVHASAPSNAASARQRRIFAMPSTLSARISGSHRCWCVSRGYVSTLESTPVEREVVRHMLVLALDTATPALTVGVAQDGQPLAGR